MINLAILCGGTGSEYQVSLQSAVNILKNINPERINAKIIAQTKKGDWVTGDNLILDPDNPKKIRINSRHKKIRLDKKIVGNWEIDCFFPIVHGTGGEDGILQGMLESLNVPYVGSGVVSSALCMSKDLTRSVLKQAGLPVCDYIVMENYIEWPRYNEVIDQLGEVLFVKPASQGSSIGISKCKTKGEFVKGLEEAFRYDKRILIEELIEGREIEISVIGNEDIQTSAVAGEIVSSDFYSYEAKYINPDDAKLITPADLEPRVLYQLKLLASLAYKELRCEGMARVDFFIRKNGEILINEVNTLPGFTKISMYPRLWELSGLRYAELIEKLVNLSISSFIYRNKIRENQ